MSQGPVRVPESPAPLDPELPELPLELEPPPEPLLEPELPVDVEPSLDVEPPLVPELPELELALGPELPLEPEAPVEEPEPEVVPESSPVELPFEESEDEHELAIAPAVIASKSRRQTMGDVLGRRPSQGPQPEAVGPSSPIRHDRGHIGGPHGPSVRSGCLQHPGAPAFAAEMRDVDDGLLRRQPLPRSMHTPWLLAVPTAMATWRSGGADSQANDDAAQTNIVATGYGR